MKRTVIAAAVLAAASLGLVATTFAQPFGGPGRGPGFGPGSGPGMMGGMGRGAWGGPAAASQARLAALKTQLAITSTQETAWQSFADAVSAQAKQMQAFHDQVAASTATAPDRATLHAAFMQQRSQGAAAVAQAMQQLYAVLSTEQRAILDQRPAWGGGNRGPFGG